jgi:hypothetical protein
MTSDQWFGLLWAGGMMVLVVSGLIARRQPAWRLAATAAVWVGIFAIAFLIARIFV